MHAKMTRQIILMAYIVQDCTLSIANALEILRSYIKPSICSFRMQGWVSHLCRVGLSGSLCQGGEVHGWTLQAIVCAMLNMSTQQIKNWYCVLLLHLCFRSSLRWRHNGQDDVSNHQPHHCLLNHLFRRRSKKTSKLRITGLCARNSAVTGEFPAQMASNTENITIWWRHHVYWIGTTCRSLVDSRGPLYWHGLTLIQACISNYIHYKVSSVWRHAISQMKTDLLFNGHRSPKLIQHWIESGVLKLSHTFEARIQMFMLHTHYSGVPNNRGVIWWRHQMETFSALLALCAGNSPATGEFPSQRPVTRGIDVFLWSAPEQTIEQTMDSPVIWDAIAPIVTSL